jgi:hypothetical protein
MMAPNPKEEDFFDDLRKREEGVFRGMRELLGETYNTSQELLDLYSVLFDASLKCVWKLEDKHQPPALMHSLQWLKNEAIAGILTLMRGHISDASNFGRRSIEICAFIKLMYENKEAAARWMKAGTSKRAQAKYLSAFPAFELVRKHLTPELVKIYERNCLDVHPSFFAVVKRASLDPDRVHRFSYFDLDETDDKQAYLIISYFNLIACHVKIMEFLTIMFYPSGHFDKDKWMAAFGPFIHRAETRRLFWQPLIDAHMVHLDDEAP